MNDCTCTAVNARITSQCDSCTADEFVKALDQAAKAAASARDRILDAIATFGERPEFRKEWAA